MDKEKSLILDMFALLHDGIIDQVDDLNWCEEFTKSFGKIESKLKELWVIKE